MKRSSGGDLLTLTLAAVAVAICCGLPLIVVFLVTTGLGAVLIAQGWLLVGLVLLAVGAALGVRYLVRARGRGRSGVRRVGDAPPSVGAELHE